MRISRPCYDKPHRCPGWIGGGMKWAKVERCKSGRIDLYDHKLWKWRLGKCDTCDVRTIPWVLTRLAPSNIKLKVTRWYSDFTYNRRFK